MTRLSALVLAAAMLAGPAAADTSGTAATPPPAATAPDFHPPTDLYGYLALAGACDEFAQQSARLALVRSRNDNVKAYARRTLADHVRTQQGLIDEAHRAGLHPPAPALTGDLQRRLDALGDLPEADFDAAYLAAQAEVTRQALVTHRAYAREGDNAILRAVAEARAPEETRRLTEAEAEARPPGR